MTTPTPHVHVYDEFSPEDLAMMQALYSRSSSSVTEHAARVREVGSGKFMAQFYVGYGHKSIADCGSTTMFLEGVSMLAAKAVQDSQLYSGQETSSRYIDFSRQPICDPVGTPASAKILEDWMEFYRTAMPEVREHIRTTCPRSPEEKETLYERALGAWTFDVMRAFLPAGITTQLSWHTNLRQAWDRLSLLRFHPLVEVQDVAEHMLTMLRDKYPNSFCFVQTPEEEAYAAYVMDHHTYLAQDPSLPAFAMETHLAEADLAPYRDLLQTRQRKSGLPAFLAELGGVQYTYQLDFGSFRDVQRHRSGVCRMPLLTTTYGFAPWYLEQLPPAVRLRAEALIETQRSAIAALPATEVQKQYYTAMGFKVAARGTYGLPGLVYLIELRSGKTVHPTVRAVVHAMYAALHERLPSLPMFVDLSADDRDVRRGGQDIQKKENT